MNSFSFEGDGCNLWYFGLGQETQANYHCLGGLLWLHSGNQNTACLLLRPTNSPLLVQPGQSDSSCAEGLIMPAKQIASEQPLVEIARADGDICHVNLQSGHQQESHAGHTYNLDRCSIGARDILSCLLFHGQPWASTHFFVSRVMATPVSTIKRPLVASPLG